VRAIEACGFAGERATIAAYADEGAIPTRGPKAALTVPGAIGGWKIALELSAALGGRLPLADLLSRAVSQAREGVPVSASEQRSQPRDGGLLYEVPNFRATYFCDGEPPKAGMVRSQPKLAETLAHLAAAGLDDFYRGDAAREIAADLDAAGSPVTRADLKSYGARWREPLTMKTGAATLYNTPVPTQGLASLMILGVYERLGVREIGGVDHAHALIEASKRAFAYRDRACVDYEIATADFDRLLSPATAEAEAARIDMRRAAPWPLPPEQGDTIWMGAIDKDGLAVSYIQSVYWEYGSGLVLPRTGVLMQNRGIAFSLDPASPRGLKPGRRPFHTLNPALAVFADGRVMPYGSMGGDGQPQFQAQVFSRIAAGRRLAEAVASPRWLWGRAWGAESATVKVEAAFDDAVASALSRRGHEIERLAPERRDTFGHAGALRRGLNGEIEATHDPRSDGGALGL
jgi:gamma-glutamyltranspeptidase/glutathione hydrolase